MQGAIYLVHISGNSQTRLHPHVVLLELDKECLLVPAFGDQGQEVNDLLVLLEAMHFPPDTIAVHLDNSKHADLVPTFPGKPAYWVVARKWKISKMQLGLCLKVGLMHDSGLLLIAQCLDRLAGAKPLEVSPHIRKKVRKLLETLLPTPPSSPTA